VDLIYWKALILGIVEGLTEFLLISSTGHLILVGDLLDFNDERGKVFEIVIQFAAILAVCWEYRAKLGSVVSGLVQKQESAQRFTANLFITFLPARFWAYCSPAKSSSIYLRRFRWRSPSSSAA
jgi:undecaprenyl-diphosphatase